VEEWKWANPVWSHDGGITTGESYKAAIKLTFFKGASLKDPGKLFNSSLEGKVRRAIDIHEGETIDAKAFKALIRAAVALNTSGEEVREAQGVPGFPPTRLLLLPQFAMMPPGRKPPFLMMLSTPIWSISPRS
jgi:hypothetical protein